ncbi:PQQ-dependent sugar dehydrogenase [Rhodococcus sp. (in: high G+C Gram-positive bacteria)]|uniref:PQQ-dependent sugar dehydrogenase n=1 Tax=Rhodococcus sp. TaxID=1831 RepID=UPI00257B4B47|nr:PQQ-dependent sugar dehydrogenase [Rhodococcus sp. (in: high G+C Gram-positive bacteria)]
MTTVRLRFVAAVAVAIPLVACSTPDSPAEAPPTTATVPALAGDDAPGAAVAGAPHVADVIATGLDTPWGLAFLPDGSALVTERNSGRVLLVSPGAPVREVGVVDDVVAVRESGLLGVAVSPDFDTDGAVYLYATTTAGNRVFRATFDGTTLTDPQVIVDGIPAGPTHNGGRLSFGPDGMLYITTGEAGEQDLAQDPASLGGKILRVTPDGAPAPGNPDPSSPVYSLGHRNVQGLAFDDEGRLWASEFGQSDADELNLIVAGGNYGWPLVEGVGGGDEFVDPVLTWPVAQASPSGLAYRDGTLWLGALRGERLWRIDIGSDQPTATEFFTDEYGRLRTVVVAPDRSLWVTTSNHDSSGTPGPEDDRILRVEVP